MAWLLWRAFEVDSWAWSPATPAPCEPRMRLRTVVTAPATLEVLESLNRPERGPPARAEEPAEA
ncbi:hypothetical protein L6R53_17955 [Myxococcota bacterium]|nr:hypothetical protein [Myxococcota bacterium]